MCRSRERLWPGLVFFLFVLQPAMASDDAGAETFTEGASVAGPAIEVVSTATPGLHWLWYVGTVVIALMLAAGIWLRQQRRLALEEDYSKRLEHEVQLRTHELADRNKRLADANEKLLEASLTDPLTGLRNRRFLFEEVTRHAELVRRWQDKPDSADADNINIVFLMIDLDHFKPVNDRCGHAAGDEMLIQIRDVLLRVCRSSDFVIRWGGDEFIVISRDTRMDQIEALAERIRCEIAAEVFHLSDAQIVRTSCSIGFACYPFVPGAAEMLHWEQVLGLADSALYMAKKQRDAWVGYLGTPRSAQYDKLFHTVRNDPRRVAEHGALEIRSSAALETTDEYECPA